MENKNNEQNRITLSIAFIAMYVTLIFNVYKIFPYNSESFFDKLLFGLFVGYGIIISFSFFLYLVFTALELDFWKEKEIIFGIKISPRRIKKTRMFLYNISIEFIFLSFTWPVMLLFLWLNKYFNIWQSFIIYIPILFFIIVFFHILLRDKE